MEKKLKLTVQYATNIAGTPTRQQFRRWIKAALMQAVEITLRIVDENEGCDLNYHFRGKNNATNVLTFVYDDTQPLSGDIVLCTAIIEQEAQQQRKSLTAHYAHLTVHGVLHLQGYDHQNDTEAAIMEQLETEIITKLGYDNPYKEQ